MSTFLYRQPDGITSLVLTNDDGFVTYDLPPTNTTGEAEGHAAAHGFQIAGIWQGISSEIQCVEVEPQLTPVSFVGEHLPENAVELAKNAGVMAVSVQRVDEPKDGKVRAWFAVEQPVKFEWHSSAEWEALQ